VQMTSFPISMPLKGGIENALFRVFCIHLCTGNLWRFFPTPILKENILITEFFLFVLCFLRLALRRSFYTCHLKLLCVSGVILGSSLYGAALNGFDLGATFYAIRLILLIVCGFQVGEIFFNRFGDSLLSFYKAINYYYTIQAIFGFCIYIAFRDSQLLWAFLGRLGVSYGGDPHIGRFVSVYLDPNFYSVIAIIPLIAMLRLVRLSPSKKNYSCLVIVLLSFLFTWSRSGMATLFILLFYLLYNRMAKFRTILIGCKILLSIFIVLLSAIIIVAWRFNDATFFFLRLIGFSVDKSAIGRWDSFKSGLEILYQHPILGVGYNYLRKYLAEGSHSSIDSSVLSTFVNFGPVVSMLFICVLVIYLYKFIRSCESVKIKNREICFVGNIYSVYLLTVIMFSSLFNNILYYQFWLIPMVAIYTYLSLCIKKLRVIYSEESIKPFSFNKS
jgi:hypothetical protein